ncbi:sin3b-related [Anaeramoeba flamelloides]|uniref:Sin3b-related n=1 Tax=Anaeramoeba flamelloides TaxID=1746091 RepID=A0ABQ8XCP5_9EUKA|nr:sin3b-related [Anaeramoeba flamelloides]
MTSKNNKESKDNAFNSVETFGQGYSLDNNLSTLDNSPNQQAVIQIENQNSLLIHNSIFQGLKFLKRNQSLYQKDQILVLKFQQILNGFLENKLNNTQTLNQLRYLFKNYTGLLQNFEEILGQPQQTHEKKKSTQKLNLVEDFAITFIYSVKQKYSIKSPTYKLFVSKLNSFQNNKISLEKMCYDISILFKDHPELIENFKQFLPNSNDYHVINGILQIKNNKGLKIENIDEYKIQTRKNSSSTKKRISKKIEFNEKQYKYENIKDEAEEINSSNESLDSDEFEKIRINNKNLELNDNMGMYSKQDHLQYESLSDLEIEEEDTDNEFKYECNVMDDEGDDDDDESNDWEEYEQRKEFDGLTEEFDNKETQKIINSLHLQTFPKEKEYFAKLKQIISAENYHHVLRIVSLYNASLLLKSDLMILIKKFIHPKRYSKLYLEFKQLIYYGNLNIQDWEKQVIVPIRDLDFTKLTRSCKSYYYLPKEYHRIKNSGKSKLDKSILNVKWVNISSGYEYTTQEYNEPNPHEDKLFYFEDQRHEIDIELGKNKKILRQLEQLIRNIKTFSKEELKNFTLEPMIQSKFFLNRIYTLYGNSYQIVVEGIKKNPIMTLNLLFERFKEKDRKLQKTFLELNRTWTKNLINYQNNYLQFQNQQYQKNETEKLSKHFLLNEIHLKEKDKPYKICGFENEYHNKEIIHSIIQLLSLAITNFNITETIDDQKLLFVNQNSEQDMNQEDVKNHILILLESWLLKFYFFWGGDNNNKNNNKKNNNNMNNNMNNNNNNNMKNNNLFNEKILFLNDDYYVIFKLINILYKRFSEIQTFLQEKQAEMIRQLYLDYKEEKINRNGKQYYDNKPNFLKKSTLLKQLSTDYSQDLFQIYLTFFTQLIIGNLKEEKYQEEMNLLFNYSSYKTLRLHKIFGSIVQNLINLISNAKNINLLSLYYSELKSDRPFNKINYLLDFKRITPDEKYIYLIVLENKISNNNDNRKVPKYNNILEEISMDFQKKSCNEKNNRSNINNNFDNLKLKNIEQGKQFLKQNILKNNYLFFSIELINNEEIQNIEKIIEKQFDFRKQARLNYLQNVEIGNTLDNQFQNNSSFLFRNLKKVLHLQNKRFQSLNKSNFKSHENSTLLSYILNNISIQNNLRLQLLKNYPFRRYTNNTENWCYQKGSLKNARNVYKSRKKSFFKKDWLC